MFQMQKCIERATGTIIEKVYFNNKIPTIQLQNYPTKYGMVWYSTSVYEYK